MQFGTVDHDAGGYSHRMLREYQDAGCRCLAIAVCLGALAIGMTSVPQWIVVALVAVVPPLVVRRFWRAPEQTISESIHDARR